MTDNLSIKDLNEMLGLALESRFAGYSKVQADTEHVIEILDRLLAFENQNSQQ